MSLYFDVKRNPVMTIVIFFAALAILIELSLLLSGRRILVSEAFSPAKEAVIDEFYPFDVQLPKESEFQCSYFTGRQIVSVAISADAFDECPFIAAEGLGLKL